MQVLNASKAAFVAGGIYFDPWSDSPLPIFPSAPPPGSQLSIFALPVPRPLPLVPREL
jgi:hypothetical protein